jgi:hypothetical protein
MDKYFLLLVVIGILFVIYLYKDSIFGPEKKCQPTKEHTRPNRSKKSHKKPKKNHHETESSLHLTETTSSSEDESLKSSMTNGSKTSKPDSQDKVSLESKTIMSDQSGLSNMSNMTDDLSNGSA